VLPAEGAEGRWGAPAPRARWSGPPGAWAWITVAGQRGTPARTGPPRPGGGPAEPRACSV